MEKTNKTKFNLLLPILFSFFVMGFVDIVTVSTSYVKQDFGLNDKQANLLPMMVFFWFAAFSLPTGILMGKTGRKKMVQISAVITSIAMIIPFIDYSFTLVLIAFILLGIGNTILQVSLNPLLTDVTEESRMTSMLTLGQFIKAISSLLGPILVATAASVFGNWRLVFPVYAIASILSFFWLQAVPIEETRVSDATKDVGRKILALLKNKKILALFSIIVLVVGFEIGLVTTIPKYFQERFNLPLDKGSFGCSLYYAARTIGAFTGAIVLAMVSSRKFILSTLAVAILSFVLFMAIDNAWVLMGCLFMIGLTCANVFAIVFSTALQTDHSRRNEISALMIMGVAGGALVPPIMGVVADATSQLTSLSVPLIALIYIFTASFYNIKK